MANAERIDNITQIVGEKLNSNNYSIWKFRMENFLIGKGYWELVTGAEAEPELPERPTADQRRLHRAWTERARRVLHWLSLCISDAMVMQIMNCSSPKDAWDILVKYYGTTTSARKIQLKQKFNNMERKSKSIQDYVTEVKTIADQLASVGSQVEDEDMVAVTLNGLGPEYKSFDTSVSVRAVCAG